MNRHLWEGEDTGYVDRNGEKIHVGDVVEFYFSTDAEGNWLYSEHPHPDFITMTDNAIKRGNSYYLQNQDIESYAPISDHAENCFIKRKYYE